MGIIQAILRLLTHWSHFVFEKSQCNLYSALTFVLTHIRPCILDVGECTLVDRACICDCKLKQHLPSDLLTVELLWLNFFENFLPQLDRLLEKLRSKIFILHGLKLLQLLLHFDRSDHSETVSVRKNLFNQSTDPVFLFYPIRAALLLHECIFKVLSGRYNIVLGVDKS